MEKSEPIPVPPRYHPTPCHLFLFVLLALVVVPVAFLHKTFQTSIVLGLGWTVLVGLYAVASIIRGVSSFPECADADAELDRNVKEAEEILKQKNCFEEVERIRREFEDKKKTK